MFVSLCIFKAFLELKGFKKSVQAVHKEVAYSSWGCVTFQYVVQTVRSGQTNEKEKLAQERYDSYTHHSRKDREAAVSCV